MSKIIYTKEQIEQLLKNENVVHVSKAIVYNKDFKIKAVKLYNEQGLTPNEIFRQAGFNINVIGKKKPRWLIHDWNIIFRLKGEDKLKIETRGRGRERHKTKNLTAAEKIKWLEAENAYLKAQNDFLAKLRAKRAE